ncbi:hypothetical protein NL676_034188 [Syzygium grande]|nr:hypothetical protein NL676_034188 [Syzygium grande]
MHERRVASGEGGAAVACWRRCGGGVHERRWDLRAHRCSASVCGKRRRCKSAARHREQRRYACNAVHGLERFNEAQRLCCCNIAARVVAFGARLLVLVIVGLAKEHRRGQGCCTGLGLGVAEAMNFDGTSNKALRLDLVKVGLAVSINLRKKERDDGM